MRGIVKASRRPQRRSLPVRPRDRHGGLPMSCEPGLSGGVPPGLRCPASPRHALLAENPNLEAWGKPMGWTPLDGIDVPTWRCRKPLNGRRP